MKNRKSRWTKLCYWFAFNHRENSDSQVHKKISLFTLVEVTMAIGVITVGMMGIMALFPIGFQATKRAIGDNYSSELAEQLLNLVSMQCKAYDGNGSVVGSDAWGEWITDDANYGSGSPKLIPEYKAGTSNLEEQATRLGNVGPGGSQVVPDVTGMYYAHPAQNQCGLFYVDAKTESVTDFSAVMALWKEKIPYKYDSNGNGVIDVADTSADIPYKNAVRLCLEISWPASIPYKQREKRYYVRDVFNPVERP